SRVRGRSARVRARAEIVGADLLERASAVLVAAHRFSAAGSDAALIATVTFGAAGALTLLLLGCFLACEFALLFDLALLARFGVRGRLLGEQVRELLQIDRARADRIGADEG